VARVRSAKGKGPVREEEGGKEKGEKESERGWGVGVGVRRADQRRRWRSKHV
jgi:hypothetical protein